MKNGLKHCVGPTKSSSYRDCYNMGSGAPLLKSLTQWTLVEPSQLQVLRAPRKIILPSLRRVLHCKSNPVLYILFGTLMPKPKEGEWEQETAHQTLVPGEHLLPNIYFGESLWEHTSK